RRRLRPPPAGPGAPHVPDRRRARRRARAGRRHRRHRVRAPVHVDARGPQGRLPDHHLRRPRPDARRGHPSRGDEPHRAQQVAVGTPVPRPAGGPRARFAELASAGRTLVMGIVNGAPDSFSDGGRWLEPDTAVAHGRLLLDQGADVLDIGGESTRPGSERIPVDVELDRVLPVVRALAADGAVLSVDTVHAETAEACLQAGATFVNDVSGGLADPEILTVAARHEAPYVLGHWRGDPATMNDLAVYVDVVSEVRAELTARTEA